MAGERDFTYRIAFEGDSGRFEAVLSSMKSSTQRTLDDISAQAAKVDLFPKVEDQVKAASDALTKVRADVALLTDQIVAAKAAGSPTGELEKGLKTAQAALVATTREFNNSVTALSKLENQLTRAGVDTRNLASEQARLAAAQRDAAAAADFESAKQALGLQTLAETANRIAALRGAFTSLQTSGKLSTTELAQAQTLLQQRIAAVRGEVTTLGGATKSASAEMSSFASGIVTKFVLPLATIATVTAAVREIVTAGKDFTNRLAEIGAVTNLTKTELSGLGDEASIIATDLGLGLNDTLRGLFDLLRSGVPKDNAIDVLRAAAVASRAAFTDLGDGVKAANILIDAFGADTKDLPLLFDKIIRGSHEGGATLKEFAANGAPLLAVARAAGVSFDELIAVLSVFVDKENDAAKATADVTKIIAKLDTTETRNKLRDLGITSDSLVGKFQQLGERGVDLDELLGTNLAGAGTKGAAALATLTNNAAEFAPKLESITKAAGDGAKGLQAFLDTPEGRSKRFDAAVEESAKKLGLLFGSGSRLAQAGTFILGFFNDLPLVMEKGTIAGTKFDNVVARFVADLFGVKVPADTAAKGITGVAGAAEQSAASIEKNRIATKRASDDLKQFGEDLIAQAKTLTEAAGRDLADIQTRADAQIAALDRSRAAQAKTADEILAIQTKAANDRFAVIVNNETKVSAAVRDAIAAREQLARKAGSDEAKIAADSAALRVAALGPVLAQYQAHYNTLIGLAQAAFAKEQSITEARVAINKSVADQIRQIQTSLLGVFDQYLDKQKHIDELVSQGRAKAIEGDIAKAKEFFDQAIAESNGLAKVIDENGNVIVTDLQARTDRVNALQKVAQAVNETFGDQAAAAKKGADGFKTQANEIAAKIAELQEQYDQFKKLVADGLKARIDLDQDSVNAARDTINDLTKPRTVVVTVKTQTAGGADIPIPEVSGPPAPAPDTGATGGFAKGGRVEASVPFARGGYAERPHVRGFPAMPSPAPLRNVPHFGFGGPVFNAPTWAKVPGTGNADTVPAALQAGSFVVRKAASVHYGDDTMTKFARGFAIGGSALKSDDRSEASNYVAAPLAARPFADGGIAARILAPALTGIAQRVLTPLFAQGDGRVSVDIGTPAADAQYAGAIAKLGDLQEKARSLPPARYPFLGMSEWAGSVRQSFSLYSADHKKQISDLVEQAYAGWIAGIEQARALGVPLTMEVSLGSLARVFADGGPARAADPARGSDTVPAMLTPGEYVISRPAAQTIARTFGGGFLDAVNQMRVQPGALAALIDPPAPVRHYAAGGAVAYSNAPTAAVPPRSSTPAGAGASLGPAVPVTINHYGLMNDDFIDRVLIPKLETKLRRSGNRG